MQSPTSQVSSRRTTLLVGVAGAVVLVAVGLFFWKRRSPETQAPKSPETQAAEAYADFRACLYGAPLEPGERPRDRLRGMELCGEIKGADADFPQCKESLQRALDAWDRLGVKEGDPRYGGVRRLTRLAREWKSSEAIWLGVSDAPFIEELEDELAKARLPDVPAVKRAPRCVVRPRFAGPELVSLGRIDAYRIYESPHRERSMRVSWNAGEDKPTSLACWFPQEGAAVAACGSSTVGFTAVPYASSDDFEDVVLWDFQAKGKGAPYRLVRVSDDTTLFSTGDLSEDGWARAGGAVFYANIQNQLMRITPGGAPERLPMGPADGATSLFVRPGFAVFRDKSGELRLSEISDDGVGPPTALGSSWRIRKLLSCATPSGPVLAMIDAQGASLLVAYPDGPHHYAAPILATTKLPRPQIGNAGDDATEFACGPDGTPRWAWVEGQVVHGLSCPRSGCVAIESDKLELRSTKVSDLSVAPVGAEGFVVAYLGSNTGPFDTHLEALRVRRGAAADLATATDEVLVTGGPGGLENLYIGLFAFANGDTAWVGARAGDALYAFRAVGSAPFEVVRASSH
ncbi:MAG: hypothetical protein U0271_31340 [Polyangiaceae bacterium]